MPAHTPLADMKHIYWHKRDKRWQVRIASRGVSTHVGVFISLEEAKKARDEITKTARICFYHEGSNRWRVRFRRDGKEIYLGAFDTEQEAMENYHVAVRWHNMLGRCPNRIRTFPHDEDKKYAIYYDKRTKKWQCYIEYEGYIYDCGGYEYEMEAWAAFFQMKEELSSQPVNELVDPDQDSLHAGSPWCIPRANFVIESTESK
jgi:hypothetical protein